MATRAFRQGQMKLALISTPVEIYPPIKPGATSPSATSKNPPAIPFNMRRW
jgi:hypothetical protein